MAKSEGNICVCRRCFSRELFAGPRAPAIM
jgi:hypothetical protein